MHACTHVHSPTCALRLQTLCKPMCVHAYARRRSRRRLTSAFALSMRFHARMHSVHEMKPIRLQQLRALQLHTPRLECANTVYQPRVQAYPYKCAQPGPSAARIVQPCNCSCSMPHTLCIHRRVPGDTSVSSGFTTARHLSWHFNQAPQLALQPGTSIPSGYTTAGHLSWHFSQAHPYPQDTPQPGTSAGTSARHIHTPRIRHSQAPQMALQPGTSISPGGTTEACKHDARPDTRACYVTGMYTGCAAAQAGRAHNVGEWAARQDAAVAHA